jgi:hypothetical protein
MTTMAIRKSDTEVQVEENVYTFDRKEDADGFMRCVADTSIDSCRAQYAPSAVRSAAPDAPADDPNRGSTISPSMGGMP